MFRCDQLGVDNLQLITEKKKKKTGSSSPSNHTMSIAHSTVGICEDFLHSQWHVKYCVGLIQETVVLKPSSVVLLLYLEGAIM